MVRIQWGTYRIYAFGLLWCRHDGYIPSFKAPTCVGYTVKFEMALFPAVNLASINELSFFLRQKIEAVRKEKVAVQKMVDNLKKQVYRLSP